MPPSGPRERRPSHSMRLPHSAIIRHDPTPAASPWVTFHLAQSFTTDAATKLSNANPQPRR